MWVTDPLNKNSRCAVIDKSIYMLPRLLFLHPWEMITEKKLADMMNHHIGHGIQGGREHLTVYYTNPQILILPFSFTLA